MGQQFAPEEFMKALQGQQLPQQPEEPPVFPETISGLTRTPEKVEYLGMRPCWNYGPSAGHENPAVILHFKPPEPANEAATRRR